MRHPVLLLALALVACSGGGVTVLEVDKTPEASADTGALDATTATPEGGSAEAGDDVASSSEAASADAPADQGADEATPEAGSGDAPSDGGMDAPADALDASDAASITCAPPSTGNAACDQCVVSNCESSWCTCKGPDEAGTSGCLLYIACVEQCITQDAGTPTACLQQVCATSAYTTPEQHEGQALIDCEVQYCPTQCGGQ